MNDPTLNDLLALARSRPPDTSREEFAFEARLLARLRTEPPANIRSPLAWRLCLWFASPAVALTVWTVLNPPDLNPVPPTGQHDDLRLAEYLTGRLL